MPLTALAPPAFVLFMILVGLYLVIGLLITIFLFVTGNRGLGAFDPHALRNEEGKSTIGFRVFIFPGLVALWPLVLWRRYQFQRDESENFLDRRKREWRPQISRRHRISIFFLLILLPPLYALALILGRTDGPPLDASILTADPGESTGVPLARASVATDLDNDFVDHIKLELLVLRERGSDTVWLHTTPGHDPLPPDTLLYWLPLANGNDDASDANMTTIPELARLLGPLPAGPGRLALPAIADPTGAGRIIGYSLAHQKILFRSTLLPVTDQDQ